MPVSSITTAALPPFAGRDFAPTGSAEQVLSQMPVGLVMTDRTLRIVFRNPAADELLPEGGWLIDMLRRAESPGAEFDWQAELRGAMDAQVSRRFPAVVFPAGGARERQLDLEFIPLRNQGYAVASTAALLCFDVTEEAGLERRLAASERLASVGKLAARVAHELNNPLDGALRYLNLALRSMEGAGTERVAGYLRESRTGLMRMAHIVGELLEYSRSLDAHLEEANINTTVEEALRAFQDRAARQGVVLAASFHQDHMPWVRGGKLFQVCCNLIKNAIDAMPDGGTLTVTTGIVGGDAVLKFEDTGVGLPENSEAIFEPFFTTKPQGQGTGLGLAICKDYVGRLNGSIAAGDRPEGGAVFTIRIPVSSCRGPNGSETIRHA